jgi:hypothetical protein
MFKHLVAIILLAVLMVFAMPYAHTALDALVAAHTWITNTLKDVFSAGQAGNILRDVIASLAIPFLFGLSPALLYSMAKRRWLPCFMTLVWVMWLIQTTAVVMEYKVPITH